MIFQADTTDLIVRMFRMRPTDPATIWIFGAIIVLSVTGLAAWAILSRRREAVDGRRDDAQSLQRIFDDAVLESMEQDMFERIALRAAVPALQCATAVTDFDRGVDGVLLEPVNDLERIDRLRTIRNLRRKLGLHILRRGAPIRSTRTLSSSLPVMICPPGPLTSGFPVAGTLLSSTEESLTLRLESIQPATRRALHGLREADVSFFNPNDASYVFRSKVLALRDLGVAFLVLSHPAALARSQRRSFARIRIDVEIPFRWIPEAKIRDLAAQPEGLAGLIEERSGMLLDLSGGGACLRTELPLEIGDYVQLALPFLPAPHDADPCFASVVRRRPEGAYGLRFEGMPQRSLAAILQFVRSEQFRSQEAEAGGQCAPGVVCGAGGQAKGTVPDVEKPR